METQPVVKKQRKVPWIIGSMIVLTFTFLIVLQSSNLGRSLAVETASDTLLLYALSSLNFIALIIFCFFFLRSILKLMRERRMSVLGSQIKTRLLIYFFVLSLLPIMAMAVFSFLFMNRALERWFSQIPENVIREARDIQRQSLAERSLRLNETATMLAKVLGTGSLATHDLNSIATSGNIAHIEVLSSDHRTLAVGEKPMTAEQKESVDQTVEQVRKRIAELPNGAVIAEMSGGRRLLIVPDPMSEQAVNQMVENSLGEFDRLKAKQITVRQVGLLTLGVLTFLLIFISSWLAIYIARGLTIPIKALAEGAGEIARGNLAHRVDVIAEDELDILVAAFNEMSSKLEANSAELSSRRKYIETILESLPTGVISFDALNRVGTINRAALSILRLDETGLVGVELKQLVSKENYEALERLLNRARRVGHSSEQTVLQVESTDGSHESDKGLNVALTATALPTEGGAVLVIEDLSELIAAQRASAWQEVARRMAHEIKNPLTPIQLSAERIAKRFASTGHVENGVGKRIDDKGAIGDVVEESTSTILREVSSLKAMVDEFSRFARLPDAKLETGNLNEIVEQAVASFEGRFADITIETELGTNVPDTMIDAEQLKRVFVNLIENAVEAFAESETDKRVTVRTRHDTARDLLVAEVADNGKGISPADLQKLFQPYFSTKGRGTGLGLAIVRRIVSEHHGKINAVANQPRGAKFIIELPVGA
ncbi:MAG: HAMP domain-containing protein [Acidobacteria bacterium]|nr:HAMP domain-containing protein [Acidobacteriota bacterium]